jgi:uncharacterized protein YjbJ (UPF0337 family)
MSDEKIKGAMENLKGRAKEAAGTVTGNKKMEAEGAAERVKGAAREKLGKAKEALEEDEDTQETSRDRDDED